MVSSWFKLPLRRVWCALFLLILACLANSGCGGAISRVNSTADGSFQPSSSSPTVALSATSVAFASQALNTTSAVQTVILTDSGGASLEIGAIATSGDFAQSNNCGTSLSAGASCSISLTFTPTATGTRTGALTITDNASGTPHRISLSGNGATPSRLSVTPSTVSFGNVPVGQTSTKTLTLRNTGAANATVLAASTSGPGFRLSGLSLPLTLAPGQSSTLQASFSPGNAGAANGSLNLTTDDSGAATNIALSGTGTATTTTGHEVQLSWNPSTSTNVAGYYVYRRTEADSYARTSALLGATSWTDTNVLAGATYYYVVRAVDADDLESANSNEAVAIVSSD